MTFWRFQCLKTMTAFYSCLRGKGWHFKCGRLSAAEFSEKNVYIYINSFFE